MILLYFYMSHTMIVYDFNFNMYKIRNSDGRYITFIGQIYILIQNLKSHGTLM